MKNKSNKIIFLVLALVKPLICSDIFDIGISYFLDAKYELSEIMFRKTYLAEEISEKSVDFYLAYCLYLNDKIESAKEIYKKLSNSAFDDPKLVVFSNLMYAECCSLLNLYEEAIEAYDSVIKSPLIENQDIHLYAFYGKIYCLYKLKKYNETLVAISLFKSFLNKERTNNIEPTVEEQIDYILADCWYQKGNYKKASESFKNFIDKYRNSYLSLYATFKLFLIHEAQKNYKEAETTLKLLEDRIDSPEIENIIKYNLARVLVKQKKFTQAIKIYQQILSNIQDKQFKEYIELELSFCLYQQRNYSKAIETLNRIKSKSDEININKQYLLGLCYFNNKNYKEAINTFSKFLKLYPNNIRWIDDVTYWLGMSYYKNKQYNRAIQTFSLLRNKKSSTYYLAASLYIAKSYKELKEYELAKLLLSSLLENEQKLNDESIGIILYELAENYKLTYDFNTSLQYLRKILDKNIQDSYLIFSTKISLAEIYSYLNNYKETEKIISELIRQKNLPENLALKAKLLYLDVKYNLSKKEEAESIAWELLNSYSGKISIEENRYIINILSKIYIENRNFAKLIEILEKLSSYINTAEERLLLDLRIIRIANLIKDYNKIYSKILKIQKENKNKRIGIVDYYLAKYYLNIDDKRNFLTTLLKFNTYTTEAYKYFNFEEISDLLSMCRENSDEITLHICENIIPALNFEPQRKIELIKDTIENFLTKRDYQKALKLSSLVKRISYDPFTASYSEFVIARIYELTNRFNWAENMYKEIIEKYPQSPLIPKVYLSLIRYYKSKNEEDKVRFYEEILIGKYPDSEETYEWLYTKSQLLMNECKYQEAIDNLKKLTNSKNYSALAQKLIADCYFNLGKYKEASVEYLRVIYLYPDKIDLSSEAQFMVGVCAEKLNLYNEAKRAYTTSKEKYPGTLWAQEADFRLKKLR